MLSRTSTRCLVCVRNQLRLGAAEYVAPSRRIEATSTLRWQSAHAWAKDLDETEQENRDDFDEVRINLNVKNDAVSHESPQTRNLRHGSPNNFRRWTPTPTAQLGIDVLGQPGEIIVLPNTGRRKRRRRDPADYAHQKHSTEQRTAEEPEPETGTKESIHEVLAGESKPVPLDEILQQIESTRADFELQENNSNSRVLVNQVKRRFNRAQLEYYILQKGHNLPELSTVKNARLPLASYIVDDIWQLTAQGPVVIKLSELVQSILGDNGYFDRICKVFTGVSITMKAGTCEITGSDITKIQATRNALLRYAQAIRSRRVQLPAESFDANGHITAFWRTLIHPRLQKWHLSMLPPKNNRSTRITVYGMSNRVLERFEAEIFLLTQQYLRKGGSQAELRYTTEPSFSIPVWSSHDAQVLTYQRASSQATPEGATATPAETHVGSAETVLQDLQAWLSMLLDYQTNFESHELISQPQSDLVVEVGQVSQHSSNEEDYLGSNIHFTSQVPFISQFLAECQRIDDASPSSQRRNLAIPADQKPRLLHLKFIPSLNHDVCPPDIHVYASLSNAFSLDLQIQEVKLTHEVSKFIGVPTSPVDLKFTRENNFIAFKRDQTFDAKYTDFLGQLAANLTLDSESSGSDTRERKRTQVKVPPLVEVDLRQLGLVSSSEKKCKYALQIIEQVDKMTFAPKATPEHVLEHVATTSLWKAFGPRSRISMRLVPREHPGESTPSLEHVDRLQSLTTAALSLADAWALLVAEKTRNTAARYPAIK